MAIELGRRVDDVFDIFSPVENQHSCMLQWLFDPREGHGQGEAIFKDFLNAVYRAEMEKPKHQGLFSAWHPGKIAISGFQSLIVVREKSMVGNGRQDLLLVDPVQRFVILVENKAGSAWKESQLKDYRQNLIALAKKGQAFAGYELGFVRIDRYKEDDGVQVGEYANWAYIDYNWLELAARRAEVRIARGGDVGNQLVIAYCRRQAGYESEDERKLDKLLAKIVRHNRDVTKLISAAQKRKRPTLVDLSLKTLESQIWVWAHQHKDIAQKLDAQDALSYIKHEVIEGAAELDPQFDVRRSDIYVIAKSWDNLRDPESGFWPLRVKVRETSSLDSLGTQQTKYAITLELWHSNLKVGLDAQVRAALIHRFPKELKTYIGADMRRMGRIKNVPEEKLGAKVIDLMKSVNKLLEAGNVLN